MSEELKACPFCGSSGGCDTTFPHPIKKEGMTTPTNWPNPDRPGHPMLPENYGKHTLLDKKTGDEINADWNNADDEWLLSNGWLSAKNAAKHFAYIRCEAVEITLTQLTELLAGERERCAKEAESHRSNANPHMVGEWDIVQSSTANGIAHAIRNLGDAP